MSDSSSESGGHQGRDLLDAITTKRVQVAIIGLGYVGLPLALGLAKQGYSVIGVEKEEGVIDALNRRLSHVPGVCDQDVSDMLNVGRLSILPVRADGYAIHTDLGIQKKIARCGVFIVCVPTPLKYTGMAVPDGTHLGNAMTIIRQSCELEPETPRLVVVESTTYPGSTRALTDQLRVDNHPWLHVAYSPERIDPGVDWENEPPKIIGVDAGSEIKLPCALYSDRKCHPVSSTGAAETTKCAENSYRLISISFANELAWMAADAGVNVWKILPRRSDSYWVEWLRRRADTWTSTDATAPTAGQQTSPAGTRTIAGGRIHAAATRLLDSLAGGSNGEARAEESYPLAEAEFGRLCDEFFVELRQFCEAPGVGIDFQEVFDAILTKRYGLDLCHPGPGVGGHCIPVDPVYLAWKAAERGVNLSLIREAVGINEEMPDRIVSLIRSALRARGKTIHGARILVLGITYKPDVPDLRESRALDIITGLHSRATDVTYCDPVYAARAKLLYPGENKRPERELYIKTRVRNSRAYSESKVPARYYLDELQYNVSPWDLDARKFDCAVVLSAHKEFRGSELYDKILADERLVVVDTCNAIDPDGVLRPPNLVVWGRGDESRV